MNVTRRHLALPAPRAWAARLALAIAALVAAAALSARPATAAAPEARVKRAPLAKERAARKARPRAANRSRSRRAKTGRRAARRIATSKGRSYHAMLPVSGWTQRGAALSRTVKVRISRALARKLSRGGELWLDASVRRPPVAWAGIGSPPKRYPKRCRVQTSRRSRGGWSTGCWLRLRRLPRRCRSRACTVPVTVSVEVGRKSYDRRMEGRLRLRLAHRRPARLRGTLEVSGVRGKPKTFTVQRGHVHPRGTFSPPVAPPGPTPPAFQVRRPGQLRARLRVRGCTPPARRALHKALHRHARGFARCGPKAAHATLQVDRDGRVRLSRAQWRSTRKPPTWSRVRSQRQLNGCLKAAARRVRVPVRKDLQRCRATVDVRFDPVRSRSRRDFR